MSGPYRAADTFRSAAPSPAPRLCGPQVYGKRVLAVRAAGRACPAPTDTWNRAEIKM